MLVSGLIFIAVSKGRGLVRNLFSEYAPSFYQ